jgi:lipoprotein signal peptidase
VIRNNLPVGDVWPGDWPVKIVHFTNSGAAFGIFQSAGPLLVVTSVIGMAAILIYLFNPEFAHPVMRAGLALMLGGAIGNLIDRVYAGEVVDFIKFPYFPAFNVADSCITIGVLLLIWGMLMQSQPDSGDDHNEPGIAGTKPCTSGDGFRGHAGVVHLFHLTLGLVTAQDGTTVSGRCRLGRAA